ncbi:SH3 domain-containing protein [Lutispora thermophila]|uniref:SH3 domain-containing protein n=1 Tax=Lutispora thermophila DSM 19022 TaxID=1122184 RepID=A0A1M6B1N9_9FIRM|nr:SH3 domain-containing protein [Lutispora thermophila]SHI42518.1 SH3 domain-containing protein [Lutispora thermophila DSM 19022]
MKKVISILLSVIIVMSSFGIAFAEEIAPTAIVLNENGIEAASIVEPGELQFLGLGYITGNGVRLRSGPGTNYPSLGSLYKYDDVAVYNDTTRNTPFLYVYVESGQNEGKEGWVHENYISITNPARILDDK